MNFASDNCAGVAPEILAPIAASSRVNAPADRADAYSTRAAAMLSDLFHTEGRGVPRRHRHRRNALSLAALTAPWQAVFCHEEAHVIDDECGAPEFFTGGAKVVGVPGVDGKMPPATLVETLARYPRGQAKTSQPGALSLSRRPRPGRPTPDEIAAPPATLAPQGGGRIWTARASPMRSFPTATRRRNSPGAPASTCCRSERPRTARSPARRWSSSIPRRPPPCLSAQAGRAHVVEGALPWRADGGLSDGRPVARSRRARQRRRQAARRRLVGRARLRSPGRPRPTRSSSSRPTQRSRPGARPGPSSIPGRRAAQRRTGAGRRRDAGAPGDVVRDRGWRDRRARRACGRAAPTPRSAGQRKGASGRTPPASGPISSP